MGSILNTGDMASVLVVGCGGVGTIVTLNLQSGGKARVTAVLRSNYEHVKKHGIHIRSLDHGVVESFRPDNSMILLNSFCNMILTSISAELRAKCCRGRY